MRFTLSLNALFSCVFLISVYNKFAEQKFKHEVWNHCYGKDNILIYFCALSKMSEVSWKRSKYCIKSDKLCHCNRNIDCRFEGILSVECKVPDYRQNKRRQVWRPVYPMKQFIEYRKWRYLYYSCRCWKKRELYNLYQWFFFSLCSPLNSLYKDCII